MGNNTMNSEGIRIDFRKMGGLVPAIIQDWKTNNILMLGFMNSRAWRRTLESGRVWFWSRVRNRLWMKGETSGNFQIVKSVWVDCDSDTLLFKVEQKGGGACHKGFPSCFYTRVRMPRRKRDL
jgi:phosphoribosyl-AMP cyclohydrolase